MKTLYITILLLITILGTPCFAETSTIYILEPNTDGTYERCDGIYIHVNHKTDEKTYYVNGKVSTLEEYNEALAAYVPPKTDKERIEELEIKLAELEADVTELMKENIR